jgi:glutaredoxin-like protein
MSAFGVFMRFIDDAVRAQLLAAFENLVEPVQLVFFTQKNACASCLDQEELLKEVKSLSDKISLRRYDFVLNGDEVMNYWIDKIPATAVVGKHDYGIRFFGLTAGFEFKTLIEDIIMVSSGRTGLDPRLEILVQTIPNPIHLQVIASLTCPYCPKAVQAAHRFAFLNENIRADMVDLSEFPHLAQKYRVTATPKTIINESHSFIGAYPEAAVYLEMLKAVNPEQYQKVVEEISKETGKAQTEGMSTPYTE